jgi:hypothetical protein
VTDIDLVSRQDYEGEDNFSISRVHSIYYSKSIIQKPEILCTAILTISHIHGKKGTMERIYMEKSQVPMFLA